jgi:hypothetical protein
MNYDVALALASTGEINMAMKAMEKVNSKKPLDIADFCNLDKRISEKALEIWKITILHDRLFEWLKDNNLPQPEIPSFNKKYMREIAVGWVNCGMKDDIPKITDKSGRRILAFVERNYYNSWLKKSLSQKYGFLKPSGMQFIDYVCVINDGPVWIIEGKRTLTKEAIAQISRYYELFTKDYPEFTVKKSIVCEESGYANGTIIDSDITVFI